MSRAHLLLIARDFVAHLPSGRRAREAVVPRPRAPEDALAAQVRAAVGSDGRLSGRVWVLLDDVHLESIQLASRAVDGLDRSALAGMLGYEAQALSGMAPGTAALGWRCIGDEGAQRRFLVVQLLDTEFRELHAEVQALGGRLAGVLHPAGLARPLGPSERGWSRVEAWPDLVATISGKAQGASVRVVRTDPARWAGSGEAVTEVLRAGRDSPPGLGDVAGFDLQDGASLDPWLRAWRRELASKANDLPLIRAPRRAVPQLVWHALSAMVLAGVAWLCFTDHQRMQERTEQIAEERQHLAALDQRFRSTTGRVKSVEARLGTLRGQLAAIEQVAKEQARNKALPTRQLELLARGCPADLCIDAIDLGLESTFVRGRARQSASVDLLVAWIDQNLRPHGFRTLVPTRSFATEGEDRGIYGFEIEVRSGRRGARRPDQETGDW